MFYTALLQKGDDGDDELEEAKETLERIEAVNENQEALLPGGQTE
jgi:hypothetical protein